MAPAALPTPDDVIGVLRGVIDPELGSDIVDLGMAKRARVEPDGEVVVTVALTTAGCPLRAQIQRDVRARVGSLPGVRHVTLDWTEMTQEEKSSAMAKARWNVAQRPEDTSVAPTTKVVLVGSVRDDGPLPDVYTDVIEGQRAMRAELPGVGFAIMVATMLHSIATGNILPASIPLVCVDINPTTVTKLADRGSAQAIGIVTDIGLFLEQLARELVPGYTS